MSDPGAWLVGRDPPPPEGLSAALRSVRWPAGRSGRDDGPERPRADALAEVAKSSLEEAAARPGRERWSAFELLKSDALLTYACEAALQESDPRSALGRILGVVSG